MLYIHQASCISPQQTFGQAAIHQLHDVVNNKLQAIEPAYEGIPSGIMRRMGKAVRLGVGAAMPLLRSHAAPINGIIIGTANGGMEDCIRFLNQIIDYDEGMLTPTNFVQSTTNAIAAQIGLYSNSKAYNITHTHRGLAFENALLDADMQLAENSQARFLVGGVDEISTYNYNIEYLGGWYKKESLPAARLYASSSPGSLAGEGAAIFLVSHEAMQARAKLSGCRLLHSTDPQLVAAQLQQFLTQYLPGGALPDLLLSGENGDARTLHYYEACENSFGSRIPVARFKHMTGEYPTASAAALWLAVHMLQQQELPSHMLKYPESPGAFRRILIYNNYRGLQHSFLLLEKPE